MITLTVTKINGATQGTLSRGFQGSQIRNLRPTTEGNLSTAAIFEIEVDGNAVTYTVSETYAAVLAAVTADTLESGAEVTTNKATDFSTLNDTLYPSVDAVEDNFAGKHAYTATTASSNTYTLTLVPATTPYVGMRITVVFANANTGACTLNAAAMVKGTAGTTALASADIVATTKVYTLVYSPQSTWQVQGL